MVREFVGPVIGGLFTEFMDFEDSTSVSYITHYCVLITVSELFGLFLGLRRDSISSGKMGYMLSQH